MNETRPQLRITLIFNLALLALYCYLLAVDFLFEPAVPDTAPMDRFFEVAPSITIVAAVFMGVLALVAATVLIKSFWNRLLADLLRVRQIESQEALAIILVLALITR